MKRLFTVLLITAFIFLNSGCAMDPDPQQNSFSASSFSSGAADADPWTESTNKEDGLICLEMLTPIDGGLTSPAAGNEDGYYDLLYHENEGANIIYIDFENKIETFLTSDIAATYNDPSNPSWLPLGAHSLFCMNGKLLATIPESTSTALQIVQMDPDGSDRKVISTLRADQTIKRGIAGGNGKLYTVIESVRNGETHTILSSISLSNGTIEELCEISPGDLLYGVYGDKIYFKSLTEEDPLTILPEWELYSYSLSTQKREHVMEEDSYKNIGGIFNGAYYFLNVETGILSCFDLEEKTVEVVAEGLPTGASSTRFDGFWDEKFCYINFSMDSLNKPSYEVYGVDLSTHHVSRVTLACNYLGGRYVWIRWETSNDFLVINGEKESIQTFTAPDGSIYEEKNVFPQFAMIPKEDYWNSIPNYQAISFME